MSENNSALQALITEAQAAYERMSVKNPHRQLLVRLASAVVGLAGYVAQLEQAQAEKPRIILPGND